MTTHATAEQRRSFSLATAERAAAARKGDLCPECGETEAIEDNGERGPSRTFRCEVCDCQWDTTFGRDL